MTLFRGRVYSVRGEAQLFWYRRNRAYRAVVDDTDGGDIAPNFFPYDWSKTCDPPMNCRGRFNFDTFGMAFLTVFVVVSQDQWNYIMYDAIRSKPKFIHRERRHTSERVCRGRWSCYSRFGGREPGRPLGGA